MKSAPEKKPLPAASGAKTGNVAPLSVLLRVLGVPGLLVGLTAIYYWPVLSGQGFLWNDFIEQNFPYRLFSAVSLKQGEFPFWNPYVFSGMPFLADVQAAVLYPFNLILTLFASREWLSPLLVEYQIVLHIALGGIGLWLLCRALGCGGWGAILASITFMFCGFLTTHIFHANLIHAAVWLPLIILCAWRAVERASLRDACLAALCLAAAFLAGYPQIMVHAYYWLGAFTLFLLAIRMRQEGLSRRVLGGGVMFAVLVGLSIGLASIQLLPTSELGAYSARPTISFAQSCEGSLRPYRFITLLAPNFFGTPASGYWGIAASDVNPGTHSYWETALYCGILPLILAVLAAVFIRRPLVWFFSAMALLALFLAMGDSFFLYGIAFKILPGLDRFRVPARFALLLTLSVAVLAGYGLQWLMATEWKADRRRARRVERVLLGASGGTALMALMVSAGALRQGVVDFMLGAGVFGSNAAAIQRHAEQVVQPQIASALWLCVLFTVLSAATIILRIRGFTGPRLTGALCCSLVFLDLLAFGYGYAASKQDPSRVYAKGSLITELQRLGRNDYFRINSRDSNPGTRDLGGRHMLFQKNQGSVNRIFLMEGYNPLRLKRQLVDREQATLDILNVKYAIAVDPERGAMNLAPNPTCLPRCRMVYRYSVEPDESKILPLLHSPGFDHSRSVILEQDPLFLSADTTDTTAWTAAITHYGLNRIEMKVTSGRDGLLVLSEIHYPAWKAAVDGRPVNLLRADYALRAIVVQAGTHSVVCSFESAPFKRGVLITIVSLILTMGLLTATFLIKRFNPGGSAPLA
jgi:hypothetical protein